MKSHINESFRKALAKLPTNVRRQAQRAYQRFRTDPYYRSLQFKLIDEDEQIYSIRIGTHYRALGTKDGNEITWYWIGSHADYDTLISQM
jgi:mRNA-degrading endonuclease RelE of RelBE toxin-antitoxin system